MAKVIFQGVVIVAAVVVIALRAVAVCGSEEGLWTEHPHSGFCPDCPAWEGGEW